ncbi:MAG: extracellular solute-binding protein [Actinomycetota bacterium]|nr:extracellular solute-binding protein [Actinomycetota bacterium]
MTRMLVVLAMLAVACGAPEAPPAAGDGASEAAGSENGESAAGEPVTLNVIDVAGNLQLTQPMIDAYVEANPDKVSQVNYDQAPAPDLAGRVRSQQEGGDLQTDLVLTGTDGLAAGIEFGLWEEIVPAYEETGADLQEILLEPAYNMQALAEGYGVVITYYPSGPLLEYDPAQVDDPPSTPDELLAWAEENPGKFMYARPANSGPGRTFLMGLPYLLGDSDPQDPESWDKTWAYLEQLGEHIEYYPSGTTQTMTELGQGVRAMIASTTGWDINPRALGTVPPEAEVAFFDDFTWVTDAHYFVVPEGVDDAKMEVLLDLLAWIHTPEENAKAYDAGYFYPGPAVEGATLEMAPEESQSVIEEFGRPEYEEAIANNPKELPLGADAIVRAFEIWDRRIGGNKIQEEEG